MVKPIPVPAPSVGGPQPQTGIQVGSPVVLTQASPTLGLTLAGDVGYGMFFTCTIINTSATDSITLTISDSDPSGPVNIVISSGQALSLNNWRMGNLQVTLTNPATLQIDLVCTETTVTVLAGSYIVATPT